MHQLRTPGQPERELADRGAGPLHVGEAERGEPLLRGLGRQRARTRESVEQGSEEEPLVNRPHRGLVRAMVRLERLERAPAAFVAVTEDAREARAGALVRRDGVGLLLVVELQSVLDGTEEPVRVVEPHRVGDFHVFRRRERVQRVERVGTPHRLVVTAVHELEQLHGELDVADPTAATLQLAVGEALPLGDALRPFLHRPDLAQRVGAEDVGPDVRACERHEAIAEGGVTGDRACLQQRLELPRLGPALVVRRVAVDRACERATATLRSQVGVGAEDDPVLARGRHDVEQRPRHAFGALAVAVVDEEHVDVARVVELTPAELSHPDQRKRAGAPRDRERGLQAHLRERGQLAPDGGQVGDAEQVAGGDAEQLEPLPPTEAAFVSGFDRAPRVAVAVDRLLARSRRGRAGGRARSRRPRPRTTGIATHTPRQSGRRARARCS